jgi:hypothetical protein
MPLGHEHAWLFRYRVRRDHFFGAHFPAPYCAALAEAAMN